MEDFNFHKYHLSPFAVIKIMKQNNKSILILIVHTLAIQQPLVASPSTLVIGKKCSTTLNFRKFKVALNATYRIFF